MSIRNTDDLLRLGYVIRGWRTEAGAVALSIEKDGALVSSQDIGIEEKFVRASELYRWVARGNSFRCFRDGNEIVFCATGRRQIVPPDDVLAEARRTGKSVMWDRDGFTFKTSISRVVQTGRMETATSVARSPSGHAGGLTDPLYEERASEGRGATLWDAMEQAFKDFGA